MDYVGVHIPVENADITAIENILKDRDIIKTVYSEDEFNQYSLRSYLEEVHVHNSKFVALLDRNIFSDIVSAVRGPHKISTTHRAACALLAFFQLSDTLIEPGMAIYEYTDSGNFDLAEEELSLFRTADRSNPSLFIDYALGRLNIIPINSLISSNSNKINKIRAEDIHRWKIHYGLTLKMAILEKTVGDSIDNIKTYLKWMYDDYLFSASAVIFGVIYFSGKRIGKMLKDTSSRNISKTLKGIRNAAWDMTIAHYWCKKVLERKERGVLWLLGTEDKAVKELAEYLASSYKSVSELKEKHRLLFIKYLGHTGGSKVYEYYSTLVDANDNPHRKINKLKSSKALYPIIDELEQKLISAI